MDNIFGISEKALQLSEDRSVLLSNNIVNSATPHYKARDIDFQKLLQQENQNNGSKLMTTQANHLNPSGTVSGEPVLYRVPMQSSLDGNTVDENIERKNFVENSLRYEVSLTFIKNKTHEIMEAIKGA